MNKTNDVTRIMSETLDKYRNSIPRKAFVRAMERVVEEVLAPTTCKIGAPVPGIQIVKRPDVTAGELAELLSGACPPFTSECEPVHCHATNCRDCWHGSQLANPQIMSKGGERHEEPNRRKKARALYCVQESARRTRPYIQGRG